MSVILNSRTFGARGRPVVILHGLFGSLENWASQARALSDEFNVTALDLRNHGQSPHDDQMGYADMAEDVVATMDNLNIDRAHIVGHSMGGKTAMQLALDFPTRARTLTVVDIAPRRYARHHDAIFDALTALDTASLKSRQVADAAIIDAVPELAVRSFLLKNLQRTETGFAWKMNLQVLIDEYESIAAAVESDVPFQNQTLFIKGSASEYIQTNDTPTIQKLFPNARAKIIDGAGHWPHVEKADVFTRILRGFLSQDST
ncbi:MAG: alpha/beta fold hydrolase [Pseudomonadota bacterium]